MRSRIAMLCVSLVLLSAGVARAQFSPGTLVFDPQNWFENASQTMHTLEVIKNQLLDLHALVVFPITNIARDMMRLTSLMAEIKALMGFDEAGVNALMGGMFGVVPCTESDLISWLASGNSTMRKMYEGSLRAQTLVNDIFELLDCITGIIDQVLSMAGNLQGLQTLGQIQSVLVHQQARMMAMMGAFHSALSTGELYRMVQSEAERCIRAKWLAPIPRDDPFQRLRR